MEELQISIDCLKCDLCELENKCSDLARYGNAQGGNWHIIYENLIKWNEMVIKLETLVELQDCIKNNAKADGKEMTK